MPGIISGLFDPNGEESAQSNTTTIAGDGETGVEASPSVGFEMSGSYEDANGTTHQWSNSTDVGADVDLDAAVASSIELTNDIT